jgi:predicted pyridoxine 5'-phosphate oxidase superfamily flavin-nucleotide-binding protein
MLPDQVKKILRESQVWVLATAGETPNVVTTMFHEIDEDDNLIFYQVFLNKTVENIKAGSSAAVLVNPAGKMEGYQLKGAASYTTNPEIVAHGNIMSGKVNLTTKGAVVIKVEKIYILTPGPDNGKLL